MKSAVIIIPTIGKPDLYNCVLSCINQTYENLVIRIVVDGQNYKSVVENILSKFLYNSKIKFDVLTENVGAGGWYGHRVYAAYSLLVNQDYVFYLDEDNFIDTNHVESLIEQCETDKLEWSYSLRKIVDNTGNYICNDDCESLGEWNPFTDYCHIDTSCYCLSLETARKFSTAIFGKWGADRKFYSALHQFEPKYKTSGFYTLNYRLGGNDGSVKKEFFIQGNSIVNYNYKGFFPWRKNEN